MIKVLHVVDKLSVGDSTIHGVTRLFSWWIPRFDRSRYDVSVCSLRKRDKAGEYLEEIVGKIIYLGRGKFDPMTLYDLFQLVKKEQIDILHLHGYGATTFGRICGALINIPCIVHEHMFDTKIPFYQGVVDCLLSRFATCSIAVSKSVRDFLVQYRGLDRGKVNIIYNGVPLEAFNATKPALSSSNERIWKTTFNIPASHKVIGIVGRLDTIKGHSYFLEAAQKVLREYLNVTFLVVGDGELMGSLEEQCKNLGIDEHVIFTGYCSNVPSLLKEIDINVIASLSEGVPLTLFEAMAAGCAIISTNVGGIGEVVMDGETSLMVPPRNSKALAEKILLLINDSDLCEAMAVRGQRIAQQYDIRNTVRQLEACYEEIFRKY